MIRSVIKNFYERIILPQTQSFLCLKKKWNFTLPETNSNGCPENWWLEYESFFWDGPFLEGIR